MRAHRLLPLLLLATGLAAPGSLHAQDFLFGAPRGTIALRFGASIPRASSEIFDFTRDRLTVETGDFMGGLIAGEIAFPVTPRAEVVVGAGYSRAETESEMRHFVEDNDLPIQQTTRFTQLPLSLDVKLHLLPTGAPVGRYAWVPSRWSPFVGAGGGAIRYLFEQSGDFVDELSPECPACPIFTDVFRSSGWAPMVNAFGGVDVNLGARTMFSVQARYTWAKAEMGDDYVDFEKIDLAGLQTTLGLGFRF